MSASHPHTPPPDGPAQRADARIARDLTGDLYCIRCGYNLKGLSITEPCPECAVPVKATVLAVVDPLAEELTPLSTPRLTAAGLLLWPTGAFLAAIAVWLLRAVELTPLGVWMRLPRFWIPMACLLLVLSGLGLLPMIRPHRATGLAASLRVAVAFLLYVPLVWGFWRLHAHLDAINPAPYASLTDPDTTRHAYRLAIVLLAAGILTLVRHTARGLAARSVIVREGRVDRQPILALIGAFLLTGCGDAFHLLAASTQWVSEDIVQPITVILIALGSVLVTLGLFGLTRDGFRVFPVVAFQPLGLSHILGRSGETDA
ncbi:MAG: hypothetical protein ACF8Q5_06560 [Phycisphaerales bacterium JB040]